MSENVLAATVEAAELHQSERALSWPSGDSVRQICFAQRSCLISRLHNGLAPDRGLKSPHHSNPIPVVSRGVLAGRSSV